MTLLRGVFLIAALLSGNTPREAVQDTWETVQEGSPRAFLGTLTPQCSGEILSACREYLETLRTMDHSELGEVFASVRLEAAPDEVEYWDGMAVLEMMMSSPSHHSILSSSLMTVDSVAAAESTATAYVTLTLPGNRSRALELPLRASPLGWTTGGLLPLAESVLEHTVSRP